MVVVPPNSSAVLALGLPHPQTAEIWRCAVRFMSCLQRNDLSPRGTTDVIYATYITYPGKIRISSIPALRKIITEFHEQESLNPHVTRRDSAFRKKQAQSEFRRCTPDRPTLILSNARSARIPVPVEFVSETSWGRSLCCGRSFSAEASAGYDFVVDRYRRFLNGMRASSQRIRRAVG